MYIPTARTPHIRHRLWHGSRVYTQASPGFELTIKLSQAASKEELGRYDLIRCVVAAYPKHPPVDPAKSLVDEMIESMALLSLLISYIQIFRKSVYIL